MRTGDGAIKRAHEEIDEDINAFRWCTTNEYWPKERPSIETFNLSGHYDSRPSRWEWLGKICDERLEAELVARNGAPRPI